MQFAVVRFAGKQFLVSPDSKFLVNGTWGVENEEITLSEVLLLSNDANVQVGTPLLPGESVVAKVLSTGKGDKIMVSKFKAKSRYRRTVGFRPQLTTLQVVSLGGATKSAIKSVPKKAPAPRAKKTTKQ